MAIIPLTDALHLMNDRDAVFSIAFVTFNKSKNTGGEIIKIDNARRVGAKFNLTENNMISVRSIDNSNHPYPVHIRLITEFNGQIVCL